MKNLLASIQTGFTRHTALTAAILLTALPSDVRAAAFSATALPPDRGDDRSA